MLVAFHSRLIFSPSVIKFYFFVFNHVIILQAFRNRNVKHLDCSVMTISDSRLCVISEGGFLANDLVMKPVSHALIKTE